MTKEGKSLTDEEIWGIADLVAKSQEAKGDHDAADQVRDPFKKFGKDICNNPDCKFEIDRKDGLKELCPKCRSPIRNPV